MRHLLVIFLLACTPALAFDDAYTTKFPVTKYVHEYRGQKDDRVFVSTPNKPAQIVMIEARKQDSVVTMTPKDEPVIIKTQWCNENGCTEWRKQ